MGAQASRERKKPLRDTHTAADASADNALSFGMSGMTGYRMHMEDAHDARLAFLDNDPSTGFFVVMDGHGGGGAAKYVASHLGTQLGEALRRQPIDEDDADFLQTLRERIERVYISLDKEMAANVSAYRDAQGTDDPGTTVTALLVMRKHLVFINLGDSRAIHARAKKLHFVTRDHKPSLQDEEARIRQAGGFVASNRVCQCLAVSRAMGDHSFKDPKFEAYQQMVSCVPEIFVQKRRLKNDEFVLLACDGIWDVVGNESAEKTIRNALLEEPKLELICSNLLEDCLRRGSTDNMTAMLICFPAAERVGVVDDLIDGLFEAVLCDDDAQSAASSRRTSRGTTERRGLGRLLRRSSAASQSSVASDKAAEGGTAATGSAASPAADSRKRASSIGAAADSLLADLAEGNERLPARREQPAARTEPIVPQPLTTAAHSTTPAANSAEAATGPASRSSGTDSGWGTPRASVNSANDAHGSNPTELPDDASGDVFPSFAAGSASAPSATANGGLTDEPRDEDGGRRLSELLAEAEAIVGAADGDGESGTTTSPVPAVAVPETDAERAARVQREEEQQAREEADEAAEMARLAKLTLSRSGKRSKRARPQLGGVFQLAAGSGGGGEAEAEA